MDYERVYLKYGTWRKLNDKGNPRYKSWWCRDLGEACGKDVKGNWFDENVSLKIRTSVKMCFCNDI